MSQDALQSFTKISKWDRIDRSDRILTREIAENIVKETMYRLHRNINIMNTEGYIIASGDHSRLGELHEGALEAIRTGKPLVVNEDNIVKWKARQYGINIPILLHNEIVCVIGITGNPSEVLEFGELVKMTTELMLNQIYLMSHREWRNKTKEFIMDELVKKSPDYAKIEDRLRMVNIHFRPPFFSLILETKQDLYYNDPIIKKTEDMLGEEHSFIGVLNSNQILIVTHGISEERMSYKRRLLTDLLQNMGVSYRLGTSLQIMDRKDIPITIVEAKIALLFGGKDKQVHSFAGLEQRSIIYLSDEDCKRRFLEPFLPHFTEQMVLTLQTFFEYNASIQDTACALFVHKNTLLYRLKRIKELTGYDPRVFSEALALQMAVWIYIENVKDR